MKSLKNYKHILSIAIMLMIPYGLTAQDGDRNWQERYRQIEAQRVSYITTAISLTPEEAQVFWPVYNEYNQKRNQMMGRHRQQRVDGKNLENLSEKELLEIADVDVRNLEEMASLRREYHERFKQILPPKKVILLYEAEREFNRKLFHDREGRQRRGRN